MTEADFAGETIGAFRRLQQDHPGWDLSADSEDGVPVWGARRRDVPRSGTLTPTLAELREWLAGREVVALSARWPRWHVYHLATGWYARRGIAVWITRDQLEQGMAYQLRARACQELRALLEWQDTLGEPAEVR